MAGMSIDGSGLDKLAADLAGAPADSIPEIRKVVSKGSLNIKRQIQEDFRASEHFKGGKSINWGSAVGYNLNSTPDAIESEIGPYVDQEGFGTLVGIAIHGGSRGGGGTVADPLLALRAEEPRFVDALTAIAGKVLRE